MVSIRPILHSQIDELRQISIDTFCASHGHSANKEDIDIYIRYAYAKSKLLEELEDKNSLFHFIYVNNEIAGYSKLIIDYPYKNLTSANAAKLERIYLLEKFYSQGLGQQLFDFNIAKVIELSQDELWLYTWTENKQAIQFYKKNGLKIIDSADFKISSRHSNPNFIMQLKF